MAKPKSKEDQVPKWLSQPAHIHQKREVENALGLLFLDKNLNVKKTCKARLEFISLLPYLKRLHKSWVGITPQMLDYNKQPCINSLTKTFHNIRKSEQQVEDCIEVAKEIVAHRKFKTILEEEPAPDDQGQSSSSDKDGESKDDEAKDGEAKDGEAKDGESKDGEAKTKGKSPEANPSLASGQSQAPNDADDKGGSKEDGKTLLGKRFSEVKLTDLEVNFWLEIGQRTKLMLEARELFNINADTIREMLAQKNLTMTHLKDDDEDESKLAEKASDESKE